MDLAMADLPKFHPFEVPGYDQKWHPDPDQPAQHVDRHDSADQVGDQSAGCEGQI